MAESSLTALNWRLDMRYFGRDCPVLASTNDPGLLILAALVLMVPSYSLIVALI